MGRMCISSGPGDDSGSRLDGHPTRRERERLQRRTEILEAAERVFVRKGYHGATVEEIAREAEFSVGTIYNFFNGKDCLYADLLLNLTEGFMAEFETEVAGISDPLQAITNLLRLRLRHYEQHRGFLRVIFEAHINRFDPDKGLPDQCRPIFERCIEAVSAIFARGIQAGVFVDEKPIHLVYCLDGITDAFLAGWSRQQDFTLTSERIDHVLRMVLRAVRK